MTTAPTIFTQYQQTSFIRGLVSFIFSHPQTALLTMDPKAQRPSSVSRYYEKSGGAKKTVQFKPSTTVAELPTAASTMTVHEKHNIWYDQSEFDRFKLDAAENAGVQLLRSTSEWDNRQLVLVGDFDESDSACEADSISQCTRGLGYHFSRKRKRDMKLTRSAVLAWQNTVRQRVMGGKPSSGGSPSSPIFDDASTKSISTPTDSNEPALSAYNRHPPLDDRSQLVVALVSTKCTRGAREAAGNRGRLDYLAAYPERHQAVECQESLLDEQLRQHQLESMAIATGACLPNVSLEVMTSRKRCQDVLTEESCVDSRRFGASEVKHAKRSKAEYSKDESFQTH